MIAPYWFQQLQQGFLHFDQILYLQSVAKMVSAVTFMILTFWSLSQCSLQYRWYIIYIVLHTDHIAIILHAMYTIHLHNMPIRYVDTECMFIQSTALLKKSFVRYPSHTHTHTHTHTHYTTSTPHLISPKQIAFITGVGITKTNFLIKKRRSANITTPPHCLFPALICLEQEPPQ